MALSYVLPIACTPGAGYASPGNAFPSSYRGAQTSSGEFLRVAGNNNSAAPLLCCARLSSSRDEEDGRRSSSGSTRGGYGAGPLLARRQQRATAHRGPSSPGGGQGEVSWKSGSSSTFGDSGIKKLTGLLPLLPDDAAASAARAAGGAEKSTVRRPAGNCSWAPSGPSFSTTLEVCARGSYYRASPALFGRSGRQAPAAVPGGATAVEAVESKGLVEAEEVINSELRGEEQAQLSGGSGGEDGGGRGNGGGGGDGAGDESGGPAKKMSPSQIVTLVYAALVGVGGLIGFSKSGSTKSLVTGGGAALALLLVFFQLPVHPTFASSVGLGISAVLLGVMFPRFKKSGKFMPAGLVALVSLIMTGGYIHGIARTLH